MGASLRLLAVGLAAAGALGLAGDELDQGYIPYRQAADRFPVQQESKEQWREDTAIPEFTAADLDQGERPASSVLVDRPERLWCVSIGFGDLMRPCCLKTRAVAREADCATSSLVGGRGGLVRGAEPATAQEAKDRLDQVR